MGPVRDIAARERDAALDRNAARLATEAATAVARYDRGAWLRLALVFFPMPLIVVVFRLSLDPTGYYALGAALVVSAAAMYALDRRAVVARDRAIAGAERARQALDEARRGGG